MTLCNVQIMAQAEQLCGLVAHRQALIEAAPQTDWSAAVAALQDRGAALSAAILDAEAHISTVLQQKRDGQANRGAHAKDSCLPDPAGPYETALSGLLLERLHMTLHIYIRNGLVISFAIWHGANCV